MVRLDVIIISQVHTSSPGASQSGESSPEGRIVGILLGQAAAVSGSERNGADAASPAPSTGAVTADMRQLYGSGTVATTAPSTAGALPKGDMLAQVESLLLSGQRDEAASAAAGKKGDLTQYAMLYATTTFLQTVLLIL
jgi:hypothetical protein